MRVLSQLFDYPLVLILLIIPFLLYFYIEKILEKKKREALKFSETSFLKSALNQESKLKRYKLLMILSLIILSLLIIGLANPKIPSKQIRGGSNIVLLLDISGSMWGDDYSPNRFEAMKGFSSALINSLDDVHNIGIITFEQGTKVAAFLTPNKQKLIYDNLAAIDVGGESQTLLNSGLLLAIEMATSIPDKKGIIVLISDGDIRSTEHFSIDQAIGSAKDKSVKIFTVGIGSHKPYFYKNDIEGNARFLFLNEELLNKISNETGGNYHWLPKINQTMVVDNLTKDISKETTRWESNKNTGSYIIYILTILLLMYYIYLTYGTKNKIP